MHLRNAPTRLMKDLGHGKDYRYAQAEDEGYAAGERYLPDGMAEPGWYQPRPRGLEARIGEKLAHLRALDQGVAKNAGGEGIEGAQGRAEHAADNDSVQRENPASAASDPPQ